MSDYFNRKGEPIPFAQYMRMSGDYEYRKVAKDDPSEDVMVSTVWLGLNHEWRKGHPPLIFETMVFGGKLDHYQERYSTEEEAMLGHQMVMAIIGEAAYVVEEEER